jgi:hypothetical protein
MRLMRMYDSAYYNNYARDTEEVPYGLSHFYPAPTGREDERERVRMWGCS